MHTAGDVTLARRNALAAGLVAVFLVSMVFVLYGDVTLNLADEGFLWYGADRTSAGDVPLRDFQSYEPGRYYWIALWSTWFGDGILALRLSIAIFEAVGLACGLLVVRRIVSHPAWLLPIGLVLVLWMFPRYKGFEHALAMMSVYAGVRLLESRAPGPWFGVGVYLGLTSFFGRNHALYTGLGILALVLWTIRRGQTEGLARRFVLLVTGGLLGSAPLLGMMLLVPGFAASLWQSVLFFLEHGANLPSKAPLPWRVDYSGLPWQVVAAHASLGVTFLLVPFVYVVGLAVAWRRRTEPVPAYTVLVSATLMGVFYLHHAAVRSDASHLAQAIHPALIAGLAIPGSLRPSRARAAFFGVGVVLAMITLTVPPVADSAFALPGQGRTRSLVTREVRGDSLRLPPGVAAWVSRVERGTRRHVGPRDRIFIAPYTPGLYSLFRKESPVWGLYFLWPADEAAQDEMIGRLEGEGVGWALISTGAIDGRDELRFWNTHPKVWSHLETEFEMVQEPLLPRGFVLLRRRAEAGARGEGVRP